MAYKFDTTVLGGLPVTVAFTTTGCDNSDCGGGVNDVDDWSICAVAGKICKKAPNWVYNRLTRNDHTAIEEECYEYLADC